jgi:2,3-bisphosphoglycerate-independent phosphoglycerate mutase
MRYAIILPDGAADDPLPALDGHTPLDAATLPHMHELARSGQVGRALTVPNGFAPGTDVATLTLLGLDPRQYYTGRAPIEAAARGLTAGPGEVIFRCNFVTIREGRMFSSSADHIEQSEAEALIAALNEAAQTAPALCGCRFRAGVSYRNLLVLDGTDTLATRCIPPHDIPGATVADHAPTGGDATRLRDIMACARELIATHPVNAERRRRERPLVTDIWLWGQGRPTTLPTLAERYGLRGAVITAVDIIRGLAVLSGMELIEVPGATGFLDTDYAAKGAAAVRALDEFDLVIVHIEAPDEAGHLGDAVAKVRALEQIDRHIVGPVLAALRRHERWRILIAPDHPTPVSTRIHSAVPPPYVYAGWGVRSSPARRFTEAAAAGAALLDPGHRLMDLFVGAAL